MSYSRFVLGRTFFLELALAIIPFLLLNKKILFADAFPGVSFSGLLDMISDMYLDGGNCITKWSQMHRH